MLFGHFVIVRNKKEKRAFALYSLSFIGFYFNILLFPKVVFVEAVCCSHSRYFGITVALRFPFVRIYNLYALWSAHIYQTFYEPPIFNVKFQSAEIFCFMPTVSVCCSLCHFCLPLSFS